MKKNDKVVMICHGHETIPFLAEGVAMGDCGDGCMTVDWGDLDTGYEMDGKHFYCICSDQLGLRADKLEVGDKVRCTSCQNTPFSNPGFEYLGEVVKATHYDALVKFKGWDGGHDGIGQEPGSKEYWWVKCEHLVKVCDYQDYGDYFTVKKDGEFVGPNKHGYKLYDKVVMKAGDDTVPAGTVGFLAGDIDKDLPCVVWECETGYSYTNKNDEVYQDHLHSVFWNEIEKYDPAKTEITIKLDGKRTYATKGDKTVSVFCHSSDTYDEATGIIEAVKKLYNRYSGYAIKNGSIAKFTDGKSGSVTYDDTWTPIRYDDGFNVGGYKAAGFNGFAIYNGNDRAFTKGRPYEIVHDCATDNDGDNRAFFEDDWIKVKPHSEYYFLPF